MDETALQNIAQQLRKPHGEFARRVGEIMNAGNGYINRYAIEALQALPGDQVLEIGMGNGFFVRELLVAYPGAQYTGADFSEAMVEEANQRNAELLQKGQAAFRLASAEQLPFAAETFHTVFTVNTAYFWENPALVLAEIHRVLKPAGQLFVAIRPKSVMQHYPFVQYGFQMYSSQELSAMLTGNGFTVTSMLEKPEPDQEINGQLMVVETLIVGAVKQ